ncbi:amidohydrolase family protein [Flammeovirgaceae bacterium SG7u.111]|nr:amidohydrolase family protein [Flammeovirgaceae bacterium SG7u.132]WPO35260.1 amidohydrolase family protein [Flammeovirgaceae bacterium SG7u.111]
MDFQYHYLNQKRKALMLFLLLFASCVAIGQDRDDDIPAVSDTYAFTNANIVTAPGQLIEKGTIIIKKGVITAVGSGISVPAGAKEIAADSMFIYAGFIDGFSHTGIPTPKDKPSRPDDLLPASPPDDYAGIQPWRTAESFLAPKDGSVESLREAGFAIAHVAPQGKMLPGQGAIILLKGASPSEMVLKPSTSLFAQFVGASGAFPSTPIGVMTKFRGLYKNAELTYSNEKLYAQNAVGLTRPVYDKSLSAFYPVIDKKTPVFFRAEELLEAHRAMILQKDLGFTLVLTGLKQGWELAPKLKATNTKVLLSLNLPEKKEEKEEKADSTEVEKELTVFEKEYEALKKRKEEAQKMYYAQAATMQKAGVDFAFSLLDTKPKDVHKNIRLMVENGLSEADALAALTTKPASILGISSYTGTLQKGKMGNLFVSTKSYFEEESNIKYVMIDGELFEFEVKEKEDKEAPAEGIKAAGTWKYEVESPEGVYDGKMIIEGDNDDLSAKMSVNTPEGIMNVSPKNVELSGNTLSFEFDFPSQDGMLAVYVSVKIDGDSFEGTASVEGEALPITGTRVP